MPANSFFGKHLYFLHLGVFDPALSNSLKKMYAVNVPPMRKNESTEGTALSTASKSSPCEPLKRNCVEVTEVACIPYLTIDNLGTTFLTVVAI